MPAFKAPRAFSFVENLSIQVKAFTASAVVVICLGLVAASAYVTLDKSQRGLHTLATTALPKQHAYAAVKDAIVAVQMKTFRYVSWASNGVSTTLLRKLRGQVNTDLQAIGKDIGTLARREDLTESQKAEMKDLVAKWKDYENSATDTLDVGRTDAPMATMMLGQTDEKFMALAANFQRIADSVTARSNAISTELSLDAKRKKIVLAIGAAIGLLLSIVVSILLSRSIVRPVKSVTNAMRQLSSGETDVALEYRGRGDEIGQMVEAAEVFRRNAIENARLVKEVQARTEELTRSLKEMRALGEVGQAVSSTLDLDTVLVTVITRAVELSQADAGGTIYEYDETAGVFVPRASHGMSEAMVAGLRDSHIRIGETSLGTSAERRAPFQMPDIRQMADGPVRDLLLREGVRAVLAVPLLREERVIGGLVVRRRAEGEFSPSVVSLLQTLATQSVLAIHNARLFREIAEKGKQLEVASQHKSQFLASMSHELRTPLNAILGFNEMMLDGLYGELSDELKEPLDETQKSGKHLLSLINNVLDLAKIEAGRMELALAEYSVQDTVERVRSTLRPLAAEKGLDLLAMVPAEIPFAHGDGGRITQCLMNLAGNSLKFTKQGKVEIAVVERDGLLRFSVSDTGIGIPPDKIDSLFTEFKQTDAKIASEYGGTGLGLSITRKFIDMHGGRIWVESEVGKGSAFIFEIPLRVAQ
jgi:signal transduction histidine kinase/DNA-binding protein